MFKSVLIASTLLAAPVVAASGAQAALLSVGLQQAGVNGGAITSETSGVGNAAFSGSYGSFVVNNVSGTGAPFLVSPNLNTNSINATASGAGTLNVFITESGLTTPVGAVQLMSSFTENSITSGWTATISSWEDNANGVFTKVTPMLSSVFPAIGTTLTTTADTLSSLYSITVEYSIVSTGAGSSNATANVINVTPTPEPASMALLAGGVFGLGLIRRRAASKSA